MRAFESHVERENMMRKCRLVFAVVVLVCASTIGCKAKQTASTTFDDAGAQSAAVALKPARKQLPPEPPPPIKDPQDGGSFLPLETIIAKAPALKGIWEAPKRDALRALLTALSSVFETLAPNGTSTLSMKTWERLKVVDLQFGFKLLEPYISMGGTLPEDFLVALRQYLASVESEPHLGVWKATEKSGEIFDFSALAAWMNREDPAYQREHIAARSKGGAAPWSNVKAPVHRWLAWEDKALGWLGMQLERRGEEMTSAELARYDALVNSPLGSPALTEDVQLSELLETYKNNEVRADAKFKGKVIRFSGSATDIKKNAFGGIYIVMTTGAEYQHPNVQCSVRKSLAAKASEIDKGSAITVRGKVSGMVLASVMVDDCEFAE